MSERALGVALAFGTACISGVAVYMNGMVGGEFEDATVYTTAKNGVAAVLLVGLLLVATAAGAGRRDRRTPQTRGQWAALLVVGVIGGSVPFVLFFEGLARATATDAAFIHKTLLVWVAVVAVPFLHERVGLPHLLAIALLLVGQALLTSDLTSVRPGSGEALILLATLMWAVEIVIARRLLHSVGSMVVGVARMGLGLIALLVYVGLTGRMGALVGLDPPQWGWAVLTGVLLAGYVGTWFAALARAPAVDVTAVLVFGAVITALLTGGFQGAEIAPVALMLITAGAVVAGFAALRDPAPGRRRA